MGTSRVDGSSQKQDTDPAGEDANETASRRDDVRRRGVGWFGLVWFACFLALRSVPFRRYRPKRNEVQVCRCMQQNELLNDDNWRVAPAGPRSNFFE